MNKTHRVVWSKSRNAFVVAHEFAASAGKQSVKKSLIAQSIAAASFVVLAGPVFGQTVTITKATAQQSLSSGESLVVTNTGTITATGGVNAVSGTSVTAVAVTNSGTIQGTKGGGAGISLLGATLTGGITNSGSTSLITSDGNSGISLGNSSVSSISNDGTISGGNGQYGVIVSGGTVQTIGNTGSASKIAGGSTGVSVQSSATVGLIQNSGSITGQSEGITIGASVGTISNSGTSALILGSENTGIQVHNGGTVSAIMNSGNISGGSVGINAYGGTITRITNSGVIHGGSTGGIVVTANGSIGSILNTGTISGDVGVFINAGSIASINNSGLITGSSDGIGAYGGSIASVLNSGTIAGSSHGINANGGSIGTISNSGLIQGPTAGIQVRGAGSIGSLVNTGTITSAGNGVAIISGSIGEINNSGLIFGSRFGIDATGGTITSIVNSGTISSANSAAVYVDGGAIGSLINTATLSGHTYGISVISGGIGSISNSGVISGEHEGGIYLGGGTITSIANTGVISGPIFGISLNTGSVGSIVNAGTIAGGNSNAGIYVVNGATLGSIVNTGTVTGYVSVWGESGGSIGTVNNSGFIGGMYGIAVENGLGGLVNSGTINSGYYGVYIYGGTAGEITNSGLIEGEYGGIDILYGQATVAGIINLAGGEITSSGYAISAASGTISAGISNSGLIAGGTVGIDLEGTYSGLLVGGITNTGAAATISGGATGIYIGDGGTVTGGIYNSGTIKGGQNGIAMSYVAGTSSGTNYLTGSLSGGIVNSGVIAGTSVAGIALSGFPMSGGIINLKGGTISGGATGISLTNASTVTGGLTNSGVISGGTYSVYVDSTSSLGPITIGGVNSAQFIGDVHALASDVTVSSGSVFSATNVFDVNSFNVAGGATVILSDPASTSGGASGITVANGFNNAGTVSVALGTTGVINGAYTQSASGTYKLGASSVSDYGVLAVNGTVDLPGDAKIYVDVASDSTLTNKKVLKGVITSTGLTASTFDVTDNLALVSFAGEVDGNNVDLVTKVNALVLADVLANDNYNAVPAAKVIDAIIASNTTGPFTPIIDDLARLQTSQEVSHTVSQLLPLLSGASNVASIGIMWELDQVIQSRLEGNPGLSSGDDYLTDRGAWVKPFGSWGNQSDQGTAPGFTSNTGGIVLGADGAVSKETRLGLAFAYASSDITGKGADASNENKVDMYQVVGYGSYALDPVTELNFQIDGGGNSNSGHRSIPAFGTNANSSYNSSTAHFGIGLGRNMPIDDTTMWTPSVRVDYTWVRSDSYNETGAGPLDLNVQSTSAEQLLTSVDAKVTHKINDYSSVFGNVGVGYDSLARNNTQIISAFAGAPGLPFATQGIGLKPWTVLAGFGVVATPQGGPEITVRYDLQNRSSFTEQSFSVKARWAF